MTETVAVDELLDRLEAIGDDVDIPDESPTIAHAELGQNLNLNAIAIGLGLEAVEYDPEAFPGLVYTPEEYDETVTVLFGHGTLFVASAISIDVQEIANHVTGRLKNLGLFDDAAPVDVVHSPTVIQVPPSCRSCGTELSGDETTCPKCGADLSGD